MYNRAICRTLVYLKPETSLKSCRTCKMIMYIWSPGIVRTVYSNIFKDIFEYSGILMFSTPSCVEQRRKGEASPAPFKNWRSDLILERKVLIMKCLYQRALVPPPPSPPPPLPRFSFAKCSILNVWQYSE